MVGGSGASERVPGRGREARNWPLVRAGEGQGGGSPGRAPHPGGSAILAVTLARWSAVGTSPEPHPSGCAGVRDSVPPACRAATPVCPRSPREPPQPLSQGAALRPLWGQETLRKSSSREVPSSWKGSLGRGSWNPWGPAHCLMPQPQHQSGCS